ncbi:respiratory burst oxidase [Canna indica]|uniref:Respiratory burst oxidase n=1 Tax=Canna indica TaxID=4628 RepID=A0AAQ3QPD8_9LILI|nr:respiratory burst oxidase [Canna indica]
MGTAKYMDIPLGDHMAHELESIIVVGDEIHPAAEPPPPVAANAARAKSAGPSRSFARILHSQSSKIKIGFRESFRNPSGRGPGGGGERTIPSGKMTRMVSSAQMGLKGLRFLDKTSGGNEGWKAVDKRFDQLAVNGRLLKENFGRCIGEPLDLLLKYVIGINLGKSNKLSRCNKLDKKLDLDSRQFMVALEIRLN